MSVDKVTKGDVEDALAYFKVKCDEEYLSADAAVTKLYDELGGATDGAVAQATITEELSKKADSAAMTAELVKKLDSGTKVDEAAHADSSTVAEAATTAVSAETATKATRDGNGNIIASTYVAKVSGKDLSTNDYTTAEKNKLAGIAEGAQVNVIESVKVNGTALTPSSKSVNVDLSGYLPVNGKAADATKADSATKATQDASGNVITSTYAPRALSSAIEANTRIPFAGRESITDMLQFANYKSGFYSSTVKTNVSEVPSNAWFNVINCKHGNGDGDGNNYGMLIYSPMTAFGNLYWRQLIKQNTWGEEKKIIDSSNLAGYMAANNAGGVAKTLTDDAGVYDLVWAKFANNDAARIRVGSAAKEAGYLEIAVGDDGTEPIYVRQYLWDANTSNYFGSIVRTATLLDASGNTSFPGTVSAQNFILSTTASTTEGAMWVVWS